MPEHDEPDAPEDEAERSDEDSFWDDLEALIEKRRKSKLARWGVENK